MKNSIVKDFVMPIAVLTVICLVISGALAMTNMVTAPIIEETSRRNAEAARKEVLPAADTFEELTLEGAPATVKEAFKAANGAGYVFSMTTKGYGGNFKVVCGIDADGKIVATKLVEHSETQGMGSKAGDEPYKSQYIGKDENLEGVETITGATITTSAYQAAIADAFTAYNMVKEG